MLKSVSKCEKLQKVNRNLQKGVELRSNKCAKCVKRWEILENCSVKMGGLEGQELAGEIGFVLAGSDRLFIFVSLCCG